MGLGVKLLRSSGVSMLDLAAKTVAVLFTTPALIHGLGKEQYGAWLLVMTVVAYYLMADLGLMFAATRFLAIAVGKNDLGRQEAIYNVCSRYYRAAAAVIVCLAVAMVPFLPWLAGIGLGMDDMRLAFGVASFSVIVRLSFRVPAILLRAHVRYDLLALASIVRTVVQAVVTIVILQRGGGIVAVAVTHASGEVLEIMLQGIAARRFRLSKESPASAEESKALRLELFRYSRLIFIGDVGNSLRLQFTPMMIPKLQGVTALPDFSIGTRLITILEDAVNSLFGGPVLSAFGQIHGSENTDSMRRHFLRMVHVTAGFSFAAIVGMILVAEAFLHRWIGPEIHEARNVLLVLSGAYALHFSQYPAYNLMHTIGKSNWIVSLCLWGGIFQAVLSLCLGLWFGLIGVVAGIAFEMVVSRGIIISWLACRCTKMGFWDYLLRHVLWSGIKASAIPCVAGLLMQPLLTPEYTRIFPFVAVYGLLFVPGFLFFTLDRDGRRALLRHSGVTSSAA